MKGGFTISQNAAVRAWLFLTSDMFIVVCVCKGSSSQMKTEADSSNFTEKPCHENPRPYMCTVCDKRFTCVSSLICHRRRHTEDSWYSCTQCEKRFQSQSTLSSHKNVHSTKYQCTECGKCFQSNNALIRHKQSHWGEKPFECSLCGKRFTESSHLAVHSRIHSGKRPYQCHVCDETFSHSMIDWVLSVCLVDMFLSNHLVITVIHCCITVNYHLLVHMFYSAASLCWELLPMFCGLGACVMC